MTIASRREFLGAAVAAGALAQTAKSPIPLVDYHAHIDAVESLERLLAISKERGVKFGVVEHAGTKENKYTGLLSTDDDLKRFIARLEGKPCFKGIQAEGLDWMTCFSAKTLAQLDYTFSDALTFPEKNGQRVELWRPWVKIEPKDAEDFMDRYTAFNVQVMAKEPIDIMANPTFLPDCLVKQYDSLWTPARMKKIVDAAAEYGVAIEINSRYRLPGLTFLKMAKKAGVKFSTGSNFHGPEVGILDYCVEAAKELGLKNSDFFVPAPQGRKAVERRKFS